MGFPLGPFIFVVDTGPSNQHLMDFSFFLIIGL